VYVYFVIYREYPAVFLEIIAIIQGFSIKILFLDSRNILGLYKDVKKILEISLDIEL
jgi:hypothetical protein